MSALTSSIRGSVPPCSSGQRSSSRHTALKVCRPLLYSPMCCLVWHLDTAPPSRVAIMRSISSGDITLLHSTQQPFLASSTPVGGETFSSEVDRGWNETPLVCAPCSVKGQRNVSQES